MKRTTVYKVTGGLLHTNDNNRLETIGTRHTDRIAQANGFMYAEMFVEHYDGQMVQIDVLTLKVLRVRKILPKERRHTR